ncbi:hypothetical protein [Actinomadura alba]|uniref:Lipoprotein n=1 Tax=Actinomadura alba TaxID=406431 RepID=A0ABR7LHH1_9ACTN|nr:hypothetical protein [Actinomadura alba]MBC6464285.1 hypothetical protein [Actinomadura alba]
MRDLTIAAAILGTAFCAAGLGVLATLACVGTTRADRARGIDHERDAMEAHR